MAMLEERNPRPGEKLEYPGHCHCVVECHGSDCTLKLQIILVKTIFKMLFCKSFPVFQKAAVTVISKVTHWKAGKKSVKVGTAILNAS